MEDRYKELSFQLARTIKEKTVLEEKEKKIREEILTLMTAENRKLIRNDFLQITYKPESKRIRLDSRMVEKKFPDVFEECAKTSDVKPFIMVKLKKGVMLV